MTADPKALAERLREMLVVARRERERTTLFGVSDPDRFDAIEKRQRQLDADIATLAAAADALDAPEPSASDRGPDGWWHKGDLRRAFLDGAKWWEYVSRRGTMWQSDQNRAATEAERRYPNGVYDPSPATASADATPIAVGVRCRWVDARNSAVQSGEVCLACGAVAAGNPAAHPPCPAQGARHEVPTLDIHPDLAADRAAMYRTPVDEARLEMLRVCYDDDATNRDISAALHCLVEAVRAERAPEDVVQAATRVTPFGTDGPMFPRFADIRALARFVLGGGA